MTSKISRGIEYSPPSTEARSLEYGPSEAIDYEFDYESAAVTIQGQLRYDNLSSRPNDGNRYNPLKVVVLTPCLARGGAEQWLIYLSKFLDPRRVTIVRTIVTNPRFVDPQFAADLSMPVEINDPSTTKLSVADCDVVLCWGLELNQKMFTRRPQCCVYVAHGEGDWTKQLIENSGECIDHLVAVSQRVQQRVANGHPCTVIHNGVDTSRLGQTQPSEQVRQSLGMSSQDFVLGYLGRFSGEKRVEAIVDAVSILPRRFKALFVGWGPGRQALMDRANARIPGRFVFLKSTAYLGDFYRSMNALCLPSSEEGFSMAMLEAMMCERAVIATPVGAAPEVLRDRVNGLLIDGSPTSIAEAAQLLDDNPDWARGIAREGQRYAEQHGHALRMARDYQQLLESLCSSR